MVFFLLWFSIHAGCVIGVPPSLFSSTSLREKVFRLVRFRVSEDLVHRSVVARVVEFWNFCVLFW